MALNAQATFWYGRPSATPSAAAVFQHKNVQQSFQNRQGHLLSAGVCAWGISTSRQALGGGFVTKTKPIEKTGHARQRTRCSSTDARDHPKKDANEQKLKSHHTFVEILQKQLQNANSSLPYAVIASTVLGLVYPRSFTWFTTRYYAPALGFLSFAVGINLNPKAFLHAVQKPAVIAVGYGGQFLVKPVLGLLVAYIAVSLLHLPQAIGSGLLLVSCVSGAQLSNYATFLVDPSMAPLSIVMTALSTMTAVVVTPALSLLLLGKQLPVNALGMMVSITQIVVVPIAAGLSLNKFLPSLSKQVRPYLPFCSVLVTSCCIGAPLALNAGALRSQFGLILLVPILIFHSLAFISGYQMTKLFFPSEPDLEGLARTLSFETGMQSSLLALSLANNFFEDSLVGLPPAISTVLMTLMGFGLAVAWQNQQKPAVQ